jgi:spore coat polysaccharide biosynthesis predicted glycosyltransferase SpsG
MSLKVVQQLAQNPQINLIVGARNPQQAKALQSTMPADRLTILPLDLSSLAE